jgi:Uma2 family endonuclease
MIIGVATREMLMNFDEYLDFEEKSEVKHEFDNGKLIEMSGGTFYHNKIGSRMNALLNNFIDDADLNFHVLSSDQKTYIPLPNRGVYPDVTVVEGEPEYWADRKDVIRNPHLLVEVLSPGTEKYDRGTKFDNHRTLPSLREYVIVAQDEPFVQTWYLTEPDKYLWKISTAKGLEDSIHFHSIGCTLKLRDIYRRVKFEAS